MSQILFPEIIEQNLSTIDSDHIKSVQKLFELIEEIDCKPTPIVNKPQAVQELVTLWISDRMSVYYPKVERSIFDIPKWYLVELRSTSDTRIIDVAMRQPDMSIKKVDGVRVRWVKGSALALMNYSPRRSSASEKFSTLASTPFPGRSSFIVKVKAPLPSDPPRKTMDSSYKAYGLIQSLKGLLSMNPTCARYVHESYSNIAPDAVYQYCCWLPEVQDLTTQTEYIPPYSDPALLLKWADNYFLIGFWDEPEHSVLEQMIIKLHA